jgi:hypothetical protein
MSKESWETDKIKRKFNNKVKVKTFIKINFKS